MSKTTTATVAAEIKAADPVASEPKKVPADVLKQFVNDVVELTKAEAAGVERFAAEYLPAYVKYTEETKSKDPEVRRHAEHMVGHILAQTGLCAANYGIKIDQSMMAALFGFFKTALKTIV